MIDPLHLGKTTPLPSSPEEARLDYVPNPRAGALYLVRFAAPEFTSLCPVTGQPDFAHLVIDYAPGETIVESKSLKLFLGAFRNHCGFHEDVTVGIGKRLTGFASEAISAETRALGPRGPVVTVANGCDFDDVAGLERRPSTRFRITHAGSFFGRRDPRPFLRALHDSGLDAVARFVGDFRPADREWAESLGLGDRLELVPYAPRATSLALQRDSEALLLLIPEADGRGRGVLSGKVFEYLAVGRPILAAVPPDGSWPRGSCSRSMSIVPARAYATTSGGEAR